MRVAFDAVMLSILFHPGAKLPTPVPQAQERVRFLIDTLTAADAKIIVPTPVLGEFLVIARQDGPLYLSEMTTSDVFDVQPFDIAAAVESAAQMIAAKDQGDKKAGAKGQWQKIKVDRQFIAVAKMLGVDVIYSDDEDVEKLAKAVNIQVQGLADLPVPPEEAENMSLFPQPATDALASSDAEPPTSQSPGDVKATAPEPAPAHPSAPLDAPGPQQPDSSQPAAPRPQSKE